jgi:SOS response regulatory protein OraA/RecX
MRRATALTVLFTAWMLLSSDAISAQDLQQAQNRTTTVDGIAARIEGDILTESEIDELTAFQKLVDGKSGSRADVIRELTDQWIVKNEAQTSRFARPSAADVNEALESLATQAGSEDALRKKMAEVGLTEAAVRRQLELQIYLNRFLDYKFRAAAQVEEQQIKDYYNGEFTQQAKASGQAMPPLDDVHAEIHRLLTERIITDRATKWLDDTRVRLRIEILPKAGA